MAVNRCVCLTRRFANGSKGYNKFSVGNYSMEGLN